VPEVISEVKIINFLLAFFLIQYFLKAGFGSLEVTFVDLLEFLGVGSNIFTGDAVEDAPVPELLLKQVSADEILRLSEVISQIVQ